MTSENLSLAELPIEFFNKENLLPQPLRSARTEDHRGVINRYGQAALDSELARLKASIEGERNNNLNRSAFFLGSLVAGAELDKHQVEAALLSTAISIGLPESEARATIKSGMDAGALEPRTAPKGNFYVQQNGSFMPVEDEDVIYAPFGPPAPVAEWLNTEPPPVDYLFENILIKGIIGGLFAQGGTGKTYLIVCLMLSAALGKQSFRTFRPTRSMRVLGLLGEDPQDMIHRRVRSILCGFDDIDKTMLADNLRLYCNRPAPLMKLDSNNPIRTEALEWLKVEVETFRPELIVIDPKSMFYGMDENSNDNNTQWVNALKELTFNGATVLYCHHVTKAMSSALELNGARGGSALADGSRFCANMRQLTEDDAKRYSIDKPWRYVEFKVTKNSYVPKLPGSIFFRFTHDGSLEEVNLQATLESVMIDELLCSLQAEASEGNFYSTREVARSKTLLPDATRKDRERIVRLAIESKMLSTEKRRTGKTDKAVLVPNNGAMANDGQNELDTFNDQENQ